MWQHIHDPSTFLERARPILQLYEAARTLLASGTWVVCSRTEDLDPEDRFARWLDKRVQPSQRWAARGVRVWHLRGAVPARVVGPPMIIPRVKPRAWPKPGPARRKAATPAPIRREGV